MMSKRRAVCRREVCLGVRVEQHGHGVCWPLFGMFAGERLRGRRRRLCRGGGMRRVLLDGRSLLGRCSLVDGVVSAVCWGEHQRAPQSGVELEICHSRYIYIYISIVGWSPSFEPAPGAAPAGLVASRDSEAPPRKGPLSLHVSPAKYMTSGRIKFPKLAHFSSAKYNSNNTSGRIGFLYTFSMHAQTS